MSKKKAPRYTPEQQKKNVLKWIKKIAKELRKDLKAAELEDE